MMHEFLTLNRENLIERCRVKVSGRRSPKIDAKDLEYGISLFLDQLIKTLKMELLPEPMLSVDVSGPAGGERATYSEIGEAAALHGVELLGVGFTVDEVVHDYGDLCQAIMDLAFETGETIDTDEFRTLNRCLDNAIALAVTEYDYQRDSRIADKLLTKYNEEQGFFTHELRNYLFSAKLALGVIKTGRVGLEGATGAILTRSLEGMEKLINRSLSEVRLGARLPENQNQFSLADVVKEVAEAALLQAESSGCKLEVSLIDPDLAVVADRELLFSAILNLLQNAFKFTQKGTKVTINAYSEANRVYIDVKDHCGGLPPGDPEKMFVSFSQNSVDKSGLGLGLCIARRSVEANDGTLTVRDVPGHGCVFTIELPRFSLN